MAVFLARMVMPRSRSSSFESITRSTCCSLERKVPLCCSMASTSVVLPWSTCAMMAMLRMPELKKGILPEKCLLPLYYDRGAGARRGSMLFGAAFRTGKVENPIQLEIRVLVGKFESGGGVSHVPIQEAAVGIECIRRDQIRRVNIPRVLSQL